MTYERVFRDERFPDVEIRNSGGATFNIWVRGEGYPGYHSENGWTNTDCFTNYEPENEYGVSEEHAKHAAEYHFDQMWEQEQEEIG